MSSRKKARLGEDKCMDGSTDTVCTTKSEPYPSITLDFGHPVDIAQVNSISFPPIFLSDSLLIYNTFKVTVAPNERYPGLSEVRIVVSNETAAIGVRAEGTHISYCF